MQSFIASMTQKLTPSHISDESKNYLDKARITTVFFLMKPKRTTSTLFPYTTLFRSLGQFNHCLADYIAPQPNPQSAIRRSEEHTSELQSHSDLVCRLLLEKKKTCRVLSLP